MCQNSAKLNNFQGKRASEKKSGPTKKHKFHEMLDLFCFHWQNLEWRELKKWNSVCSWSITSTMCVPNFIQIEHLSASKGWRRKKWSNHKAQTSRDSRPVLLPITKSWVEWNVENWDFTCNLVSYPQSVCAKIHPNRTTFRVKGLAQKKVVKPKRSIVTRCLTYFASNNKISGQRELKKLKLCM